MTYRLPHEVLGVAPDAPLDAAEDAYHRLLRQEHPDLHQGAGPERVAQAEQRTRELNAAISAFRDGAAARAARARATTTGPAPGPSRSAGPTWDPRHPGDDGRRSGTATDEPPGWTDEAAGARSSDASDPGRRPTGVAPCPWCGRLFDRAVDLKDHVFAEHDLRLDRKARGSLFGGRFGRLLHRAAHLPLWGVIPVNLALAALVGAVMTALTDDVVGWWAAGVTMTPTAVVMLERASEIGS